MISKWNAVLFICFCLRTVVSQEEGCPQYFSVKEVMIFAQKEIIFLVDGNA